MELSKSIFTEDIVKKIMKIIGSVLLVVIILAAALLIYSSPEPDEGA